MTDPSFDAVTLIVSGRVSVARDKGKRQDFAAGDLSLMPKGFGSRGEMVETCRTYDFVID